MDYSGYERGRIVLQISSGAEFSKDCDAILKLTRLTITFLFGKEKGEKPFDVTGFYAIRELNKDRSYGVTRGRRGKRRCDSSTSFSLHLSHARIWALSEKLVSRETSSRRTFLSVF